MQGGCTGVDEDTCLPGCDPQVKPLLLVLALHSGRIQFSKTREWRVLSSQEGSGKTGFALLKHLIKGPQPWSQSLTPLSESSLEHR